MPASSRSVSRAPRPAGATPPASSACHQRCRIGGRQHDFEPVFAGVAGARDPQRVVARRVKTRDSSAIAGCSGTRRACARGPADPVRRSSRGRAAAAARTQTARIAYFRHPRDVSVRGTGVDDHAIGVLSQGIDDQIVEHAALFVEHAGVERAAVGVQAIDIVREQLRAGTAGRRVLRRPAPACARRRTSPRRCALPGVPAICEP